MTVSCRSDLKFTKTNAFLLIVILLRQCNFHRKKIFHAVHYFIHLNLALSLLLGYVVFMAGIEAGTHNRVSDDNPF